MRRFNVGLVTSISLSLVCAATSVGAPLPDPPFPGGGFIPPSREVLKPEDDVLKILAKYAA